MKPLLLFAHIISAETMECGTLTPVEEGSRPGRLAVVTSATLVLWASPLPQGSGERVN